jgi:outer membrane protein insertion porin family
MHRILLLLSFLILSVSIAFPQELPVVNVIEIKGLKRIEEGAVKSKISQKTGEPISQDKTNEDIKSIFKMGYFDDVKVDIEAFEGGVKLIYIVKEKPTIIKIELQGNKEFDDSELKEQLTITPGAIADTVLIQHNAIRLRKYYEEKGYWLSNIVPVTKKISEDEIGLTYQIEEGSKIKIKKIIIEGNNNISSRKIKRAIGTKEWWLFSFITSSGYYKKDRMESDLAKIRTLYFNKGYIKVIVAEPEINLNEKKKRMTINIKIAEGDQYKIATIDFKGNRIFDNETIKKKISLLPGRIFNKNVLEKDMSAIASLYSENGYALVSVLPDIIPDDKNKTASVTLNINEGDKYRIGRIEISGNTKTRDKVIRREVRLDEGEMYDSSKLKRSYERINNLNFFEKVDLVPKPKYEEKIVDIGIEIKERETGFFSIGGGYSTVDQFIATAELTQGNLFGKGYYLKLKGELGGRSSFYEISFRNPWFLDKPISFATGIYNTSREFITYDKKATGGYISFGKRFWEYWNADISYRIEDAEITNIDEDASIRIKDQEGERITSSISPSVTRDSRNNYIDPTKGSRNSLSFTFAGLGGDNAYIKGLIDSGWYFPIGATSIMVRGRFGYARGIFGETLPLYERFYVGGIYTIRGLDWGDAGPKDEETGDAIGGSEEIILNTEFIFPILPDLKLKGVVFFDTGNSYDDFKDFGTLRYTTGAGFRWISPLGPMRIEWGYNIDRKPEESSSKLEFAFGSFF